VEGASLPESAASCMMFSYFKPFFSIVGSRISPMRRALDALPPRPCRLRPRRRRRASPNPSGRLHGAPLVGLDVLQLQGFQALIARHFTNLSVTENLDVFLRLYSERQVLIRPWSEVRSLKLEADRGTQSATLLDLRDTGEALRSRTTPDVGCRGWLPYVRGLFNNW